MNPYRMIIEEITVDGQGISLGRCHRSTVARWAKKVNDLLASDNASWRVKANYKACCLEPVDLPEKGYQSHVHERLPPQR